MLCEAGGVVDLRRYSGDSGGHGEDERSRVNRGTCDKTHDFTDVTGNAAAMSLCLRH